MIKTAKISIFLLLLSLLVLPGLAQAQVLPPCTATGNCGVCDFVQAFVNVIRWVLGVVGGSALFMFVWYGLKWLASAGNKEAIETGRKGLMAATVGMIIVIGAWLLVNITMIVLLTPPGTAAEGNTIQQLFSNNNTKWYQYCIGGTGTAFCKQGWGEGVPCDNNGRFCLKRGGSSTYSCENTAANNSFEYQNACHYWATHPTRNEFSSYRCVENKDDCKYGLILGPGYCTDNNICCEPLDGVNTQSFPSPSSYNLSTTSNCENRAVMFQDPDQCEQGCQNFCAQESCPDHHCIVNKCICAFSD